MAATAGGQGLGGSVDSTGVLREQHRRLLEELTGDVRQFTAMAQQLYAEASAMRGFWLDWRRCSLEELDRQDDLQTAERNAEFAHAVERLSKRVRGHAEFDEGHLASAPWDHPVWKSVPASAPTQMRLVRLGQLSIPGVDAPPVPLAVPYLDAGNLVLSTDDAHRSEAVVSVGNTLLRLLAGLPPTHLVFDVYDPKHLGQSLAQFSHLRDLAPQIAKASMQQPDQLRSVTDDLVSRIAFVSERILAGRWATLGDYTADNGYTEPYRTLVLFDFPSGVDDETLRNLERIADRGPACGVNLMAVVRQDLNRGTEYRPPLDLGWLSRGSLHVECDEDGVWQVKDVPRFVARFDSQPPDSLLRDVSHAVGEAAREAVKPTVGFRRPSVLGGSSSLDGLVVHLGDRGGSQVELRLDSEHNNVLVAGKSGSGKSNLLHVLVNGLAAHYGPDQLQMYLLDFKEGVEFDRYAPSAGDPSFLPQVRVVSCESSRDFGIAVLRDLMGEIKRRKRLMNEAGSVGDIVQLRQARPDIEMPRLLVVIDEFQKMLQPDDPVAHQAVQLLEQLARQSRSFGIHLVLASQTLAGIDALGSARDAIFGQFAVRIGLQLTSADAARAMSQSNLAPAELRYRGQAVLNRELGESPDDNEQVQVAEARRETLDALRREMWERHPGSPTPFVYRGGRLAAFDGNPLAERLIMDRRPLGDMGTPALLVGTPLGPTPPGATVDFPLDLPGSHLLVVGEQHGSTGALGAAVCSLAAQLPPGSALFQVAQLAGQPGALDAMAGRVRQLGHPVQELGLDELFDVLREAHYDRSPQPTFLVVHGLHRTPGIDRLPDDGSAPPIDGLQAVVRDGHHRNWHLIGWAISRTSVRDLLGVETDRVGVQAMVELPRSEIERCIDYQLIPRDFEPGEQRGFLYSQLNGTSVQPFIPFDPTVWAAAPADDLAVR